MMTLLATQTKQLGKTAWVQRGVDRWTKLIRDADIKAE